MSLPTFTAIRRHPPPSAAIRLARPQAQAGRRVLRPAGWDPGVLLHHGCSPGAVRGKRLRDRVVRLCRQADDQPYGNLNRFWTSIYLSHAFLQPHTHTRARALCNVRSHWCPKVLIWCCISDVVPDLELQARLGSTCRGYLCRASLSGNRRQWTV